MKKCPYCAEEIQDDAIKCRFCGTMLAAEQRFGVAPSQDVDPQVRSLLLAGKKIEAIKVLRQKTNVGLKEAKDYIDALESGGALPSLTPRATQLPQKSNPVGAIAAIAIVVAVIGWASGLFSTTDSGGRFVMPQGIAAPKPVVTMAEFNRIENGMTYEAVTKIIGAAGQLQSQSDIAGYSTVMYSWMNSNGSNMNAMFQNNKLVQKAQFGLP